MPGRLGAKAYESRRPTTPCPLQDQGGDTAVPEIQLHSLPAQAPRVFLSPNPFKQASLFHCPGRNLKKAFVSASSVSIGPSWEGQIWTWSNSPAPPLPPSGRGPLLFFHLQAASSSSKFFIGSGPTETSISGQSRRQPASILLHFQKGCSQNVHLREGPG